MATSATTLTAEQQEARRGRITSTRIVKLVNGKALDVFNDMMGYAPPFKDNNRVKAGRRFERAALEWVAEEKGWAFDHQPGTVISGRYATSPDAILHTPDDEIGEVKWRGSDQAFKYESGEATEDETVQTVWHQGVTGIHSGQLILVLGGNDPRVYPVEWDAETWLGLTEIADRFLRDHIDTGKPPPLDGSDAAADYLRARFPVNRAPLLVADDVTTNLALELRDVRAELARLEAREAEIANTIKNVIGDAEGVAGSCFKATWKATKPSRRTDWKAVADELGASTPLIDRYTTETPGSRRFLVTWKET